MTGISTRPRTYDYLFYCSLSVKEFVSIALNILVTCLSPLYIRSIV